MADLAFLPSHCMMARSVGAADPLTASGLGLNGLVQQADTALEFWCHWVDKVESSGPS